MKSMVKHLLLLVAVVGMLAASQAAAMTDEQQRAFDRIGGLGMEELTGEAAALLERKYPDEDWAHYRFPDYVHASEPVTVGYRIAAKEPYDLKVTMCYCFCDAMGHDSLLNCFWKDGRVGGAFDEHGAGCTICYGQAMLAFLWKNLGASDEEIRTGMEAKFAELIEGREDFLRSIKEDDR